MTTDATKTYVLDTSVLLADPQAMSRFAEHAVVVPLTVLVELDGKKGDPELGWRARAALRELEALRLAAAGERMTEPVVMNAAGGTARVEINHQDLDELPVGMRAPSNDNRILSVAHLLSNEGADVTLVSKDIALRVKAAVLGLTTDDYMNDQAKDNSWSGVFDVEVQPGVIDGLFNGDELDVSEIDGLQCVANAGVILRAGSQSVLARIGADGVVHRIHDCEAFGVRPRSAGQRFALDLLTDPDVGIVSLGGPAGTGKTLLAVAAGLEAVVEHKTYQQVVVYRPIYSVGGQDLGFLPGDLMAKMDPFRDAILDALEAFCSPALMDEVIERDLVDVQPISFLRGRSLRQRFCVLDEAQNLDYLSIVSVLSRLGEGSKIVLCHDVAQRDNPFVGRHDGVIAAVERMKGEPLFGHTTLTKTERSPVAEMVIRCLDAG